jgi:hypothetical protein
LPGSRHRIAAQGVVTLSQIERDSPITANAEAWDFNDLACCSIADIKLIALNVTTARKQLIPGRCESNGGLFKILWVGVRLRARGRSEGYFESLFVARCQSRSAMPSDKALCGTAGLGSVTRISTIVHSAIQLSSNAAPQLCSPLERKGNPYDKHMKWHALHADAPASLGVYRLSWTGKP